MPPSSLPSCYKPQIIRTAAPPTAVVPPGLSSSPNPIPSTSSASLGDTLTPGSVAFPELSALLGVDRVVGSDKKDKGESDVAPVGAVTMVDLFPCQPL